MEFLVTIWNGRNKISFRQNATSKEELKKKIKDLICFSSNCKIEEV